MRWVRDLVCVMEAAGGVGTWGKCCYVYMRIVTGRFMVSCYVCGAFMYTIYVSYMYVLGYNVQGYGNCSFCSRTLTRI